MVINVPIVKWWLLAVRVGSKMSPRPAKKPALPDIKYTNIPKNSPDKFAAITASSVRPTKSARAAPSKESDVAKLTAAAGRLRRGMASYSAKPRKVNPVEFHNIFPPDCHGSDVLRPRVFHRETTDPPRLHTAARASIKSRAPETILPGESPQLILHLAGKKVIPFDVIFNFKFRRSVDLVPSTTRDSQNLFFRS